jgi:CRP-like cAMP-binding protein
LGLQLQGVAEWFATDHLVSDRRGHRLAGDIVGLRSVLLRTADHSFSAITDATVSAVDAAQVLRSVTEFPRLGAALLWAASRDEAMVVEHLVGIGRRSAIERTAHFLWSSLSD